MSIRAIFGLLLVLGSPNRAPTPPAEGEPIPTADPPEPSIAQLQPQEPEVQNPDVDSTVQHNPPSNDFVETVQHYKEASEDFLPPYLMEILDVDEYIGISPILLFVMTAVSTAGLGVLFIALFSENQKLKNEAVVLRREVEELSRGGVKLKTLRSEMEEQERSLRAQNAALEKRQHESWVTVRQLSRRSAEAQSEMQTLRARLTAVESKMLEKSETNVLDDDDLPDLHMPGQQQPQLQVPYQPFVYAQPPHMAFAGHMAQQPSPHDVRLPPLGRRSPTRGRYSRSPSQS